jgi:hypothetical protein
MCSKEDDPSQHDVPDVIILADSPAAALAECFYMSVGEKDDRFWEAKVEDLEATGYVLVPLAGALTEAELVVLHDHVVRTLTARR